MGKTCICMQVLKMKNVGYEVFGGERATVLQQTKTEATV